MWGLFGGAHAAIGRKNQLTDWSMRVSEFEHEWTFNNLERGQQDNFRHKWTPESYPIA